VDHQQGFVVGVSGRGAPIEGSRDHRAVVDHGEFVMRLVATSEARGRLPLISMGLTELLRDAQDSHDSVSPNPMQGRGQKVDVFGAYSIR